MHLLRYYLSKEVIFTFLGTLFVLLGILLVQRLALLLNDVMNGAISSSLIFSMLGIQTLRFIVELVPLSFLISSIVAFGRLYKDSEMTAMYALGMPIKTLYRVLYQITIPLSIILMLLSFWIIPHFAFRYHTLQQQAKEEAQLTIIKAGTFRELGRDGTIVYVQSISEDQQEIQGVFIKTTEQEKNEYAITLAETGRQLIDPGTGTRFLLLKDGNRYNFAADGSMDVLNFSQLTLRLDTTIDQEIPRIMIFPTDFLFEYRDYAGINAELHRRYSTVISLLVLVILIPALAHTNPRQGNFGNLLIGIFIYVIYFNLLNVGQTWMRKEITPNWLGLWWIHLLMFGIGLIIAYRFNKRL